MGQKTNPTGFRLILTQKYLSNWYSNKFNYSNLIYEDFIIRKYIHFYLKKTLRFSSIEINRIVNNISDKSCNKIILNILYPSHLSDKEIFIDLLRYKLKILLFIFNQKFNKIHYISIKIIKNLFEDPALIANYISDKIKDRISIRRIIKQIFKRIKLMSIKGIKIKISGRLNGINIARSETQSYGLMPLHTINNEIKYTNQYVKTKYGIIGIKVWLYK